MTTLSQVKRWLGPLLQDDSRLALIGRNLVLKPAGHLLRGVYVDSTSNRLQPRLLFYAQPLFDVPTEHISFLWSREEFPHQLTDERFEQDFRSTCRRGLDGLSRVVTVEDFLREAEKVEDRPFGPVPLARYKLRHAVVLAVLGRFGDALEILQPALQDERAKYSSMLTHGHAELAKRPRSGRNTYIEIATAQLQIVASLEPLIPLMNSGDRQSIAALLRRNEERNAEVWQVRDLWQPSPFPFELGGGD